MSNKQDDIHDIVACVPHTEAAKIIAFHNAALAAERSKAELAEYQWKEACKKVQTLTDTLKTVAQWDEYAKEALAKLL